ncbi:MAG: thioredoxin II-like protein [Hyperionvirus sp.]|uniref:Thioredoxin II-like protein n=1 Tax=Hyperionvirus sp. TaxID=2487770 RepID=A0A3G5A8M3_9VIRU|nr:MAG: thioredoxin II-like protein [Hyperionvirus sp.]
MTNDKLSVTTIQSESDIQKLTDDPSYPDRVVVIYFTATWCPPCKKFYPVYNKFVSDISKNFDDKINFASLDVDLLTDFCKVNKITNVPTMLFLKGTTILETIKGTDLDKLTKTVENILNGSLLKSK